MARSGCCTRPRQRGWSLTLLFLIILSCCSSIVCALENSTEPSDVAETNRVARWDEINADRRYPPPIPREGWHRRSNANANVNDTDVDILIADEGSLREWSLTTVRRSSSSTSADAAFPSAFETLGNNFTSTSCPQFFSDFLSNSTFKSCHAISMLLQNSGSFFKVLQSPVSLDQVIETSCSADETTCTDYMAHLASELISDKACGQDYKLGNALVVQAYTAMIAYRPVYRATCLKDPSTGEFCFTEAATNPKNVAGYYVYFLPIGIGFPGSSRPICNECLQATMEVFAESALIKGQPLAETYIPAAQQINMGCGPGFVNATVKVGSVSSGGSLTRVPSVITLGVALLFGMVFGML